MGVISFGIDFIFMCNRCSSIDFIDIYDKKNVFLIFTYLFHTKKRNLRLFASPKCLHHTTNSSACNNKVNKAYAHEKDKYM